MKQKQSSSTRAAGTRVPGSGTTPQERGEERPPERCRLTIELLEDRASPQVIWGDIAVNF